MLFIDAFIRLVHLSFRWDMYWHIFGFSVASKCHVANWNLIANRYQEMLMCSLYYFDHLFGLTSFTNVDNRLCLTGFHFMKDSESHKYYIPLSLQ